MVLVTSIAALAMALDDHSHIADMDGMVKIIKDDFDQQILSPYRELVERLETMIETKIGHQMGYR